MHNLKGQNVWEYLNLSSEDLATLTDEGKRYLEVWYRSEGQRQQQLEVSENLPPVPEDLWPTTDPEVD